MSDNRTKEDKLDDAIVNIAIFIKALLTLLVVQPLTAVIRTLRWLVGRFPIPTFVVVLTAMGALILDKAFTGQVDPRVFATASTIIFICVVGMAAVMWPSPRHSEFQPVDHKSIPRDDWFSKRELN